MFADINEARDAINRGWLPDVLPPDAEDIFVQFDLETGERLVEWQGSTVRLDCFAATPRDETILGHAPSTMLRDVEKCSDGYASEADGTHFYWQPPTGR